MSLLAEFRSLSGLVWRHPANRGSRGRALLRLLFWQIWKRVLRRGLVMEIRPNRRFKLVRDSKFSSLVYYNLGYPDWDEVNFLRRALRSDDGFLDIGANVGFYTVLASTCVRPDNLWAAEAHPLNVGVLREQLALNRLEGCHVLPCALGAAAGRLAFAARDRETGSLTQATNPEGFVVEVQTLDDWLGPAALPEVMFAKMDVEGCEVAVLAGAGRLLARGAIAVWLFELSGPNLARQGTTAARLVALFRGQGCAFFVWNEDERRLVAVDPLQHGASNFLACRRGPAWLEARLSGQTA